MSVNEVLERLEEMKARSVTGFSSKEREFIRKYYYLTTGTFAKETSCGNCYFDYFVQLYNLLKKTKTFMQTEQKFLVKRGMVVMSPGIKSVLSRTCPVNENDAIEHLAAFPEKIKQFEVFPNDWKKLVEKYKKSNEIVEEKQLNDDFIIQIAEKLKNGDTKTSIEKEFKGSEIDGVKLTVSLMKTYIKEADKLLENK